MFDPRTQPIHLELGVESGEGRNAEIEGEMQRKEEKCRDRERGRGETP